MHRAVIVLLLLHVGVESILVCIPRICDHVRCPDLTNCKDKNGRVKEKAGFCGCCDACVTQLERGKKCISALLLTNTQPTEECSVDKGLVCDPVTWTCLSPKEINSQPGHFRSKRSPFFTQPFPRPKNDFASKQCKDGMCWCVTQDGINLGYNTALSEANDMKCVCAGKAYNPEHLLGNTFRCDKKGNFKPFQCIGSMCSCVDPLTGVTQGMPEHIGPAIGNLKCAKN
uniref:U86-Liphistoxin-Lth1a_1 n=2 Tax=Liphistius TaxID=62150 RepID=A0A4Q8K538_9ARAC